MMSKQANLTSKGTWVRVGWWATACLVLLSAAWSSPALAACGGSLCDWQFKLKRIRAMCCSSTIQTM